MQKDTEAVYSDKFEFNESVANCFEDMLKRSIPQYESMREAVFNLAVNKCEIRRVYDCSILDIGCSNGLSLQPFIDRYGNDIQCVGIDSSKPMIEKAKERFRDNSNVQIIEHDLRNQLSLGKFDLITSILCIMFTPMQHRQRIIQNIYDSLKQGGMFIMVEKVLGNSAIIDDIMVNTYHQLKLENGYSKEQILRKKLSLEGVQTPVTSNWNVDLLTQSGFKNVDVFWRWMNFVGYVAIKQ